MIRITELTRTCEACPSQWEGRTADGDYVYIRYRWGTLSVGIGNSIDSAIDDRDTIKKFGDGLDGSMSYSDLRTALKGSYILPISEDIDDHR